MDAHQTLYLPEVRRNNLLQLFSEYVQQRLEHAPSEQISGLDREFAALIQVHIKYFTGMKSGARTIGDKLARQIETFCKKSKGSKQVRRTDQILATGPEGIPCSPDSQEAYGEDVA